jgi:hypothetical protein
VLTLLGDQISSVFLPLNDSLNGHRTSSKLNLRASNADALFKKRIPRHEPRRSARLLHTKDPSAVAVVHLP